VGYTRGGHNTAAGTAVAVFGSGVRLRVPATVELVYESRFQVTDHHAYTGTRLAGYASPPPYLVPHFFPNPQPHQPIRTPIHRNVLNARCGANAVYRKPVVQRVLEVVW
jgi:hypothetical protein